jgi:hypothetical protein
VSALHHEVLAALAEIDRSSQRCTAGVLLMTRLMCAGKVPARLRFRAIARTLHDLRRRGLVVSEPREPWPFQQRRGHLWSAA